MDSSTAPWKQREKGERSGSRKVEKKRENSFQLVQKLEVCAERVVHQIPHQPHRGRSISHL